MVGKTPKRIPRPDVDGLGRSALHYAAADADASKVRVLLASGADASIADDNGWTPPHFAAQSGSFDVASLLVSAGASAKARDRYGNSPLRPAIFNAKRDRRLVQLLIKAGADPDEPNNHGNSVRGNITNSTLATELEKLLDDA